MTFSAQRNANGSLRLGRALSLASLIIVVTLCALPRRAGAADEGELTLTTEKVIVFKDGYCLVLKRAVGVTDEHGDLFTQQVPEAAVLGSFWATPKEGRLVNMTAGWTETAVETVSEVACQNTLEILEANVGKTCWLQLPDRSSLKGEIAQVLTLANSTVLDDTDRPALGFPFVSGRADRSASAASSLRSHVIAGTIGSQFVLKTEAGDVLVPVSDVRRLTINEMKTARRRKVTTTERSKRLTLRFAAAGQRREVLLMYFRPGVRWIPTYRVNLTSDKQQQKLAEISLQAEILNEAEDLIDAPTDIVVGVPNFRFRTNVSPLILEKTLVNTLLAAAPNLMGQFRNDMSNSLYTQRSGEFRRDAAQASAGPHGDAPELPDELTASGAQDLFVYNLPPMTLRQGERVAVPILSAKVPYRDVYTWDLHLRREDIATAPSGSGVSSPLVLSQNKIWRQIELVNTTSLPWTTGAAMIMQGRQPLGQELLTYTSPRDACRIPVTVSIETRGSFVETETRRELKALRWSGSDYARIHQQATLDVCNNKSETIDIEMTLRFGGKADEVSHGGTVTLTPYRAEDWQNYRGQPGVNNSSVVVWKTSLKAGETFQPTVAYHFYTRH